MATPEFLILSTTEPDRAGLLAEVTGYIAERGCNVEDSRLVVLGGYAGLMLLLSGDPEEVQAVIDGLGGLREASGIRAVARRVAAREPQTARAASRMAVRARAIDHEGIIHALAETVRRNGGNILDMETATESAPMSGEPLFTLRMSVALPDGDGGESLMRELQGVAHSQAIELDVQRAELTPGAPIVQGPERRATTRPGS